LFAAARVRRNKRRPRRYEIAGNSILGPETLDGILTNALGSSVTLDQIRKAIGELQLAYRERGFPTVAVTLPQQQITNATIRIQVTEGVLAEIEVVGNHHFSSNNIMRALPSLRTNTLLNSQVFQRELDLANGNRDRQIYPVIGPGPDSGTSSLKLKVKDRLPVHGRFELNNQATPGTPDLRMNLAAQYNNLWQHEHQFGLQYSFTPEELKDDDKLPGHFFDQPLVVNYSAYYRLPIGNAESVQETIDANRFDYGYSEVTHQFRLPPGSGRPELTFYASRSTVDTGAKFGPSQVVKQQTTNAPSGQTNATLTIFSQDSGRDLTLNENLGTRVIIPLSRTPGFSSTFSFGADFKRYHLASFNTNNFHGVFSYTDPQLGSINLIIPIDPSPQPVQSRAVDYAPFTISLDLSGSDKYGSTALSLNSSINLAGLLSNDADFARAAYSTNAKAGYSTLNLSLTRDQKLFCDWSVLLRGNGQLASGALISNEQFGIGGTTGVRGYAEGEEYGDTGWRVLVEPRTPLANIGMVDGVLPMWVRASVFMDYAERRLSEAAPGRKRSQAMWGTGIGVVANIGQRYDMRLTVAWPLLDTPFTSAGRTHVYFGLGAQF
jgi:hemolysin activation/secretion protein